jgi:hypothetical protein
MAEEEDDSLSEDVEAAIEGVSLQDGKVSIEYTQSNQYRIINADGAQGAFTQSDKFFFKLYSQHVAFPTKTVREIDEDGTLGDFVDVNREDVTIERVMECGVMLDFDTLQEIHAFLGRQLEILEKISEEQQDAASKDG